MVMRALAGGELRPGGDATTFEVLTSAAAFDSGIDATSLSELGKPLVPGLPADFAPSLLAGLERAGRERGTDPLPSGTLRVDRAGYDLMGSSEAAFFQAGVLLRAAFSAMATGDDVAARLAERLSTMPVDATG
jgi:hypothetical protein